MIAYTSPITENNFFEEGTTHKFLNNITPSSNICKNFVCLKLIFEPFFILYKFNYSFSIATRHGKELAFKAYRLLINIIILAPNQ